MQSSKKLKLNRDHEFMTHQAELGLNLRTRCTRNADLLDLKTLATLLEAQRSSPMSRLDAVHLRCHNMSNCAGDDMDALFVAHGIDA
ncbi:MAG: hypothetical protein ACD_62C00237G0002 [uncultured bacterium]|nr:MAG: hypothetical protein ACD_62C00237G0002 [uncultured bacterium]